MTFTRRHLLIDGDQAAEFFTVRGTHSAPFHGVAATARRIDINGAYFYAFGADGLIIQDQRVYDVTRMMVQLGMLKAKPSPAESVHRGAN
jgi:predicted ester cyclase